MANGKGVLQTSLVAGRTAVTRAQATNPLKLLCPRRSPRAAWVYVTTYGGGLVAGDQIDLTVNISSGTTCVLTSQASTKVYKSPLGNACQQSLSASIGEDALLVVAPDPITCFADAKYQQQQQVDLRPGGSLVLVDWLTSGRRARHECWMFSRYYSRIDIAYDRRRVFLESLLLDPTDGPIDSPYRLGRFHCMALLVFVGPALQQVSTAIIDDVSQQPIEQGCSLVQAASPIPFGVVLRVLGTDTESVGRVLRSRLEFLSDRLDGGPWSRKW